MKDCCEGLLGGDKVYLHGALDDSNGHNGILQSDLIAKHQPRMSYKGE